MQTRPSSYVASQSSKLVLLINCSATSVPLPPGRAWRIVTRHCLLPAWDWLVRVRAVNATATATATRDVMQHGTRVCEDLIRANLTAVPFPTQCRQAAACPEGDGAAGEGCPVEP